MTLPHSDIQAACNIPYLNEILFINIDNLNETDQLIEVLTGAKDLISSGRIKSLGLQSDQAFQIHKSDTCLLDVFSVLESNRLGQFCTAIRAPFNLLEPRLFLNGSIDFAKANGLMVFCDRALMIHPRTRSGFKTYTLLRSVSSHSDVDLIRPLKLAMNNVIHLEKRAETAGISLPWGRRIAGNSDQLMNLYAWNLALQTKIRPGLVDCLENLRNCRDRRAWANHYEESFQVLIERMTLAVEHCAYHEIEAIKQSLHEIGGYDLSVSIEDMISLLLRELNVDVAFSPGSKLSINHDVPARRSEEMKQLFKSIADTSFYFEKSKSRLFPLLNP